MGSQQNSLEYELLERWAASYRIPLRKYFAKRIPADIDADDLVQEVFLRLAKHSNLSDIKSIEGYIFRIASNTVTDFYRHRSSRAHNLKDSFDEEIHGMAGLTPERVLMGRQSVESLVEALYELPEQTCMIFVLYHFEHLKQAEIASRLNVSLRTVERHLATALSQLLKEI